MDRPHAHDVISIQLFDLSCFTRLFELGRDFHRPHTFVQDFLPEFSLPKRERKRERPLYIRSLFCEAVRTCVQEQGQQLVNATKNEFSAAATRIVPEAEIISISPEVRRIATGNTLVRVRPTLHLIETES